MGRHLNEVKANQAQKNILFAQTGGNASENHYNIKRLLCDVTKKHREAMGEEIERHPMEEFMQATFDDEVVYAYVDLVSESSSEKKRVAVAFLMESIDTPDVKPEWRVTEDLDDFQDVRDKVEVDTSSAEDRKYLNRSSHQMMRVASAVDLRFIYDKASDSIIGVASMKGDDIDTWVRFPQYYSNYTVESVRARRQIGLEGSDGKMACTLAGHQGQGSTMPCPLCLWKPKKNVMKGALKKDDSLRWDEFDNEKMYHAGKDLPNVSQAEIRHKVKNNKNIAREPLFRIHPHKKHCGLMHGEMGCFSHIEKRLISRLKGIEARINLAGTKGREIAQLLQSNLGLLKEQQQELRSNLRKLRKEKETVATRIGECEARAERERDSDGCVSDRTKNKMSSYEADDSANSTNIKQAEEAISNLQTKIDAHADNIDAVEAYFRRGNKSSDKKEKNKAGTNNYILINILDEAYAVQGVGLGQYHRGRAIIHRHMVKLLSSWPTVMQWFLTTIQTRFPDLFDMNAIEEEFFKATECLVELAEVIRIQCKQSKLTIEEVNSLGEHWDNLGTILDNYYPSTNPWWKLHNGIAHVAPAARYLGFLGNANEQGFESWHAYYNRLMPTLRNIPDAEKRAQTLRQLIAGGSSEDIALLKQDVQGKKITRTYKGRKGVQTQQAPTLRDRNLAEFLEIFNYQYRANMQQDDDQSTCSDDDAVLDVDALKPSQVRYELKRRGRTVRDDVNPQAMRQELKDLVEEEVRQEDNGDDPGNDEPEELPYRTNDEPVVAPPVPNVSVDVTTADDADPVQGVLLCTFLETPDILQGTAAEEISVIKCPLCEKFVPEIGLAFHIVVRHDACESLPLDGEDEDADGDGLTDSDIEDMDGAELEKMCREHNLSDKGSASALRSRLICHLFPAIEDEEEDEDEDDDGDAIESILEHKKTSGGKYEFHVHFCSGEECWSDLGPVRIDAPHIVREYLCKSGLSKTEPEFAWAVGSDNDDSGDGDGGQAARSSVDINAERERILALKVAELRNELRKKGEDTTGLKSVLQERLLGVYSIDEEEINSEEAAYMSAILYDSSDVEDTEDDEASLPGDSGLSSPNEKRRRDILDDGAESRGKRQRRRR